MICLRRAARCSSVTLGILQIVKRTFVLDNNTPRWNRERYTERAFGLGGLGMTEKDVTTVRRTPPVVAVVALLTTVLTVLLIAFAWPAARSKARDVPIGIAGPAAAVAPVSTALKQNDAFELHVYGDRAAAVTAIEDREVYGAIVAGPAGPEMLTASAGSPAIAQILTQLAARLTADQPGAKPATVTDVVPLPADDPRGAGLAAGSLPLVLGGILGAVLLSQLVAAGWRRIAGAFAYAVAGGLALAAVQLYWIGALEGNYWADAGVISLAIGAGTITILGLEWLLGAAGFGLGAATMMLLGNPLSGVTTAPEMLPDGWSTLGRLLPPGASASMLRSVAFFDRAAITRPALVLSAWLVFGLLLCGIGLMRDRSRRRTLAPVRAIASDAA